MVNKSRKRKDGGRDLLELDLFEVSATPSPMNKPNQVLSTKSIEGRRYELPRMVESWAMRKWSWKVPRSQRNERGKRRRRDRSGSPPSRWSEDLEGPIDELSASDRLKGERTALHGNRRTARRVPLSLPQVFPIRFASLRQPLDVSVRRRVRREGRDL